MKIKVLKNLLFVAGLSILLGLPVNGQTLKDAIDAYNSGLDLKEANDFRAAIESFEKSREIAGLLGEEGEEVKEQAEIQIPGLYYDIAMGSYRERKIDEAVEGFEEAIEISDEFNDPGTKRRSENVLHQLYAIQANSAFRENNNEEALKLFDMALAINPQHSRSYLGKGLVYRRLEDAENFREAMDKAIESGLMTDEEQIVQTAESTARDFFLVRAVRAKGEENLDQAIDFLTASMAYDQSFPETHFLFATIYNEQSRFRDAVNSAQQALDLIEGGRDETAKVYFELGKAYSGLGNTGQACNAFKEAAFGSYEASARYQVEHVLKCQ